VSKLKHVDLIESEEISDTEYQIDLIFDNDKFESMIFLKSMNSEFVGRMLISAGRRLVNDKEKPQC